ncbi:MAG TPA: MFS transporter [Nocardioides sp.]|nr:MFS transporter [Nocardioides sp.]
MGFVTYADVLRIPLVRRILILGMVVRVPLWAGNIALTLHVVTHLHGSYADAGFVAAVQAAALGISGPWRGRLLDRLGVRRAITPSLVVLAITWSIAPWVGYWPLLGLASLAGLFTVPSFSIVRAVLIGAVPEDQRTTALSIDSIATELTFMVGPVLGVLAATTLPTPIALFACEMSAVAGSVLIWWANPPLQGAHETLAAAGSERGRLRMSLPILTVLAMSLAAVIILTGEDLGTVATLREWDMPGSIGWMLALWGLGSAVGGLLYGALHTRPSATVLLLLLGLSTVAVPLAHGTVAFTVILFVSGAFCAPTMTAMATLLSHLVPPANRGEAMGWHGSAMMLGSAAAGPLIGIALDGGGWRWGFLTAGLIGLAIGLVGLVVTVRATRVAEPVPVVG